MAVKIKSKETTRRIRRRKLNYRSMLQRFILSSQSSSSEDSKKKSVCIIAKMWTKNTTYCFKFDPDQDDNRRRRRILSPNSGTCRIGMNMWEGSFYAAIGSTMYWFGDNLELDNSTNFPESGWKHGPPMTVPRMIHIGDCHNRTVIDGKLYVFGFNDLGRDRHEPWGECFDPIKNRWEALPNPPVLLNQGGITSVFHNKILVGVSEESGEFYGYDTITNSWSLLLSSRTRTSRIHTKPGLSGKAVRVNNTLYFFNESRLALDAYDLDRSVWFVGYSEHLKLDGLVVRQCPTVYFFQHLVGGGGGGGDENLCVVWDNDRLDRESGLKCINFIKFRVTKRIDHYYEGGEGVLDMHIQSSQMFLMDSRLSLQHVLLST